MKIQAFSLYLCRKILKNILMEQLCRLLFISFLFVSACVGGGSPSHRLLERADSLLDVRPDSALRLLQEVSPRQLADRGGRMHYALLLMQAKYKNYLPVSEDDTLARELVSYYADAGDAGMQARAYYNLGCVYEDRQEPDLALKAYHEAGRQARRAGDTRTLCRTYNNLAYICLNQGMPGRADSLYAEVEQLARQAGDSVRLAEALLRRGSYALALGDTAYPLAEQRIKSGYGLARGLHSATLIRLAYYSLGLLFDYTGHPEEALKTAQEFVLEAQNDTAMLASANLLLGNVYCRLKRYDGADSCLQQVIQMGDCTLRERACALLSHLAEQEGDYERSLRWEKERKKYNQMKRAVFSHEVETAVAAKEVELAESLRSRDVSFSLLGWGMVALVLLGAGSILIGRVNRRKKERTPMTKEDLSEVSSGPVMNEPAETVVEDEPVMWDYSVFKKKMQDTEAGQILASIWSACKKKAVCELRWDVEQREAFLRQVEVFLPGHQQALTEHFPGLTEKEVTVCYLYLLGFSDEQVGIFLERDRSTAYRWRKLMMLHKMGLESTDMDCLVKTCHLRPEIALNATNATTDATNATTKNDRK